MASDKMKAALRRELELQADRGVGLAELLDHLHTSNHRFARRNRLSDEELDELSLYCWVRHRCGPGTLAADEARQACETPSGQVEEMSDRFAAAVRELSSTPPDQADEPSGISPDQVHEPRNTPPGQAHELWAGFRDRPSSGRARSRRLARSAS
jgi:hypothetical protein